MSKPPASRPSRRELLKLIGAFAGSSAMYRAMGAAGVNATATAPRPLGLQGKVRGTSVLVLGAGIAGLVAAHELSQAGYQVTVLEYGSRAGGRSWTIRGGDSFREMGGAVQSCHFDPGQYFNPGPMRIAYDHHAFLAYCSRFNVPLEAFSQCNGAAYIHSTQAFGGKPQRFRHVQSDFEGGVAELLAKATHAQALDESLKQEDVERLLQALRQWGALDDKYRYVTGEASSRRRGYEVPPGAGLDPPRPSAPLQLSQLLESTFWKSLALQHLWDWQPTLLQPVGGMDRLAAAIAQHVNPLIRYKAKVTSIQQDERGVRVTYTDGSSNDGIRTATADWCVCAIPASILGQIPLQVGQPMLNAIAALAYGSTVKVALQFKRRFWEQDEGIYGGVTFTDLGINQIVYPSYGYGSQGKGVLTGAFVGSVPGFKATRSFEMSAAEPEERVQWALREGALIHPQYRQEFETGISVAWHRMPGSLGCFAAWHTDNVEASYKDLCAFDGRIVLAGEHASQLLGWQEGAILSAVDAIHRLHERARQHDGAA